LWLLLRHCPLPVPGFGPAVSNDRGCRRRLPLPPCPSSATLDGNVAPRQAGQPVPN